MKLLIENWRKYLLNEDKVDYQAVQRFLDSLPTSVATNGMDGPLLAKLMSLYPRLNMRDFLEGRLTLPDRLLKEKVSHQTLTLYRGTGDKEFREAMTGKVTHLPGGDDVQQFGSLKYLTTELWYAQYYKWGGRVIAYKFSGNLIGPLNADLRLVEDYRKGRLVDLVIRWFLWKLILWKKYPEIDGVYGPELGVRRVMTYGIKNMASLTVDIAQTKKLNKAEEDEITI